MLMSSPGTMAGGLALYEGLSKDARYEFDIANTKMALGAMPGDPDWDIMDETVKNAARATSKGTIFDQQESAHAVQGFASVFGPAIPRDSPMEHMSPADKAKFVAPA